MRKNDLIKRLNNIPGNPEIVLWNGFVEDYQPISREIVEIKVAKHSKDYLAACLELEGVEPAPERGEADFKNQEWELINEFADVEQRQRWYGNNIKSLFVLSGKSRNKRTFDRLGEVCY